VRTYNYILDKEGNPVAEPDIIKWGTWLGTTDRHLALDIWTAENVKVSTVFLGLDCNWREEGEPILWETMIFGGKYNEYGERYSSKEDALEGHKRALAMVKGEILPLKKLQL
jgi:hypothetical protein